MDSTKDEAASSASAERLMADDSSGDDSDASYEFLDFSPDLPQADVSDSNNRMSQDLVEAKEKLKSLTVSTDKPIDLKNAKATEMSASEPQSVSMETESVSTCAETETGAISKQSKNTGEVQEDSEMPPLVDGTIPNATSPSSIALMKEMQEQFWNLCKSPEFTKAVSRLEQQSMSVPSLHDFLHLESSQFRLHNQELRRDRSEEERLADTKCFKGAEDHVSLTPEQQRQRLLDRLHQIENNIAAEKLRQLPPMNMPQQIGGASDGPRDPSNHAAQATTNGDRKVIWKGTLELTRDFGIPLQVSEVPKNGEVKVESWPAKFVVNFFSKQYIKKNDLEDSKTVMFSASPCEELDELLRVMGRGYAGCVHLPSTSPGSSINELLFLFTAHNRSTFIGYIPNDQQVHTHRLMTGLLQEQSRRLIQPWENDLRLKRLNATFHDFQKRLSQKSPAPTTMQPNQINTLQTAEGARDQQQQQTPEVAQQQQEIQNVSKKNTSVNKPQLKAKLPIFEKTDGFIKCEICDGFLLDQEELRQHLQWVHKFTLQTKMISRPPLKCKKCKSRFYTDQGLERHLLGSHGLVSVTMQEAANSGKDKGRCPVCLVVCESKLLDHTARVHGTTLKSAHLSYRCTICTTTFASYEGFLNHVHSAHPKSSAVNKNSGSSSSPSSVPKAE